MRSILQARIPQYERNTFPFLMKLTQKDINLQPSPAAGNCLNERNPNESPLCADPVGKRDTPARRMLPTMLRALSLVMKRDIVREVFEALLARGVRSEASLWLHSRGVHNGILCIEKNAILAEYAKIEVNETAHIPAYASAFPEFLHNELAEFAREDTRITPVFFLILQMTNVR